MIEIKSKCSGCDTEKFNFQKYSFLEFPLKDINAHMYQNGKKNFLVNKDGTNPDVNLYECFDYYQKTDLANGQNQMYCNICNMNKDTFYGSRKFTLSNYFKKRKRRYLQL